MRQVGVLAAAGLVALRDGDGGDDRSTRRGPRERPLPRRGAGRHRRASSLARRRSRSQRPGRLDPGACPDQLRRCSASSATATAFIAALARRGVLVRRFMPARPGPRRDALRHRALGHRGRRSAAVREALDETAAAPVGTSGQPARRRGRLSAPRARSPDRVVRGRRADARARRQRAPGPLDDQLLRPRRIALPARRRGGAGVGHAPRDPRLGRPPRRSVARAGPRRTSNGTRRTSRRSRRWTRRRCPPRRDSSATWSSTTSGSGSSEPTRCGSGSAGRTGASALGDALFPLFTRDFAPLPERLAAIAARLEGGAALPAGLPISGGRRRRSGRGSRSSCGRAPTSRASSTRSGPRRISRERRLPAAERRRLRRGDRRREGGDRGPGRVDRGDPARARRPDWPIGAERYGELLAASGVRRPRRRRDPGDRLGAARTQPRGSARRGARDRPRRHRDGGRSSGSRTTTRRPSRRRSRATGATWRAPGAHLIERDLVTDPARRAGRGHRRRRAYLRGVMPFAAYFEPARWDPSPVGMYVVTPDRRRSPRRDARALPGGDQQHEHPRGLPGPPPAARARRAAPVADPRPGRRPGVRRGLGHVQRADAARARLRRRARSSGSRSRRTRSGGPRGSCSTSGCTAASSRSRRRPSSSIEHTGFERPNALAEARRYTYTPTYNLSYLLGKVLLLQLRATRSSAGSGARSRCATSTTRCSAAARSRSASTAGRCAARAAPSAPGGVAPRAGHPGDRRRARPVANRVLARRLDRHRRPDRSAGAHRRALREPRRAAHPRRRLRRRPAWRAR